MANPNRRKSHRRRARTSVKIECRKGAFGLGANLASGLLDFSDIGARLVVSQAMDVNSEIELVIVGYGMGKPIKRQATVRWIVQLADGGFCIGTEFRKRLLYRDWQNLASPN
jgi:hypothetical protein